MGRFRPRWHTGLLPYPSKGRACAAHYLWVPLVVLCYRCLMDETLAWFKTLVLRLQGRPAAGSGWEAIATEGDEVEMFEGRTRH
jgi:hypothetical protein